MLDCTISFSLWWTMVKVAIYTQKCEQKWLKINNRGVEIKMSWVEKNWKINNWGGGTIIRLFRTWEYIQLELLVIQKLIDNTFSNFSPPEIIYGNIIATISDHLPQFSFVPNILSNPSNQKSNFYERDWSKFNQENFILDYFDKDWADSLQIDQQNVNLSMDSFLNNINYLGCTCSIKKS